MMNIEELVKKHGSGVFVMEKVLRAALTEQAAGYEQKLAFAEDATQRAEWQAAQAVPSKLPTDAAYRWFVENGVEPESSVHKLGKRLAELLDADQFAECEPLLLKIYATSGSYKYSSTQQAWETWQAAQAEQSVPVVGEPVAWLIDKPLRHVNLSKSTPMGLGNATQEPLYRAPTTSITAAELDRLQEGEACAETVLEAALVKFPDAPTEFECIGKMAAEVVRQYDAELERLRKCENGTSPADVLRQILADKKGE